MTLEEMCRQLIMQGIADEIIDIRPDYSRSVFGPDDLTAGDLVGMANLLENLLKPTESQPTQEKAEAPVT